MYAGNDIRCGFPCYPTLFLRFSVRRLGGSSGRSGVAGQADGRAEGFDDAGRFGRRGIGGANEAWKSNRQAPIVTQADGIARSAILYRAKRVWGQPTGKSERQNQRSKWDVTCLKEACLVVFLRS